VSVVIRNLSLAEDIDDLKIPTRPDGSFYNYEMICDGGWSRLYSDTITDLLSNLIPGYSRLNELNKLAARIRHAVDTQVILQAKFNFYFLKESRSDQEDIILLGDRHLPPQIEFWSTNVPLILVDAFYAPFSQIELPISTISTSNNPANIAMLTPAEGEFEYLRSLVKFSVIDLNISKNEVI
jgi:hypothetical protein